MMRIFSIFFFVLLLFACGVDYNSSTQYPIDSNPNYDKGQPIDNDSISKEEEQIDFQKELANSKTFFSRRTEWENPQLILPFLGELNGKTIADIGAGQGFFTFILAISTAPERVIAIDIDQAALNGINTEKRKFKAEIQQKIETRLATPDNPKLDINEVDVVFISETITYIENPIQYLADIRKSLKQDGKLFIIDLKKKRLPEFLNSEAQKDRIPLYEMEQIVEKAGFTLLESDDTTLLYHYMIRCGL